MNESSKFWDGVAEGYARKAISDEDNYKRKLSDTQSHFTADMQVLEFGCGTGTTALSHAPFVKHIDAVDISEKMLEIGREKASVADIENVTFTRGTLAEFNAEIASQDVVLGLNVIHLLPDRKADIAEVYRVLKPGGVFVSSTVCLAGSFLRFIKLLVPLGKLLGKMPDLFILSENNLVEELKEEGFSIEKQWSKNSEGKDVFIIARKVK